MKFALTGPSLSAELALVLAEDALTIDRAVGGVNVTPAAAKAALALSGQDAQSLANLSLREPARLSFNLSPINLPLKTARPEIDWARATDRALAATITLDKPIIADNVMVQGQPQSFGIANVNANIGAPLAAIAPPRPTTTPTTSSTTTAKGPAPTGILQVGFTAELIGENTTTIIARAKADATLDRATGKLTAQATISDVATARADQLVGKPGLISGAVGDRAAVALRASRESAATPLDLSADINTPRLSAGGIKLALTDDAVRLAQPLKLRWDVDGAWLARYALAPTPATSRTPAKPAPATLQGIATIQAEVRQLSFALAPKNTANTNGTSTTATTGPLRPGLFALDATARIDSANLLTGPRQTAVAISGLEAALKHLDAPQSNTPGTQEGPGLAIDAAITSIRSGTNQSPEPVKLTATIRNLADSRGNLSPDSATVTAALTTGKLPTALVEAFTGEPGSLQQLLGPELTLIAKLDNVSKAGTGGTARIDLKAPNASIVLGGPIANGVMATRAPAGTPLTAQLSEFRSSKTVAAGPTSALNPLGYLGFVAGIERLRDDVNTKPSMIASPDLAIPIDGDLTKLSGTINIDLGRVNIKMEQNFLQLLDIAALNRAVDRVANAQQRAVPPFAVNIDRGIARYSNVELPIGSYTFRTTGTVDLPNQRLDIVTYVPTLALAPGILSGINEKLGKGFGKILPKDLTDATMIPVRTSGPSANPSTTIDIELFVREFGSKLLNPENILGTIGNLFGPKPEPKPQPEPKNDEPKKPEPKKEDKPRSPFPFPIPLPTPR